MPGPMGTRAPAIARAEWDSSFFGERIGRLVPDADEGTDLGEVARLDRSAFDCVWVDLDVDAAHVLHRWSALGAHAVDARVELAAPLDPAVPHAGPPGVEPVAAWSSDDRADMTALAVEQSIWSRLARDPAFAGAVPRMYESWVGLALSGRHQALVWRENGRIVGMLTERADRGVAWIELVDVRADRRGRGIGRALVAGFLRRAAARGHAEARVRTQLRNLPAIRTYERAGFAVARVSFVLHWWTERRQAAPRRRPSSARSAAS